MANDLIVRVLGDTTKFERSLKSSTSTVTSFERTLTRVGVTAEQSANAQVAASLRKDARLREEIALYRQIATSAEKGSREQVVAANLAQRAESRLARSMGVTAAEARGLSAATGRFNRDLSAATRGAAAGSGIFRGLGHSIVFASGGFLAFTTAGAFLRASIDQAKEAQIVEAQLEQQFKNNGRALGPYRAEIDRVTTSLSALSGFEDDELKGALTTILRTQPNVAKALRDTATAADLARAKRIGLAQSATLLAKVEGGNTTLLRRQGIQVAKNATVEQALATLRQKVAGQARAGTTEQERFGAVLKNTEEIIGVGVLPTLNEYLARGSVWLEQMNESGKLQRDVARAAHDFGTAVDTAAGFVKTIDRVTGSFGNTLKLLLALKVASTLSRWSGAITGLVGTPGGSGLDGAATKAGVLRSNLGALARTGTITIGIDLLFSAKGDKGAVGFVERTFGGALIGGGVGGVPGALIGGTAAAGFPFAKQAIFDATANAPDIPVFKNGKWVNPSNGQAVSDQGFWNSEFRKTHGATERPRNGQTPYDGAGNAAQVAQFKKAAQALVSGPVLGPPIPTTPPKTGPGGTPLTAKQRNEFFDNAVARILRRGALGDIQQQIDSLEKADRLIAERIKVTKDVTRRLNLEDQLLTNQAQIRSLKAEQAANAAQAEQDAHQKLLDALQARADARNSRQFKALGLTAEGDTVAPSVRQLRNALGRFEDVVTGTFLDTSKTESTISRLRRVLSGGLGAVGRDVRLKIQSILQDLNQQLDQSTEANLTKWKHLSTQAILAGVPDLTASQKRILADRLSVLGHAGGAPPSRTQAFALAATAFGKFTVNSTLNVDGEKMATNTTSHQIKRGKQRTIPRSG